MKAIYFFGRYLAVIVFTILLSACGSEKLPAVTAGSKVLILGDSLSYGTGAGEHQDFPTLLAQNTGWDIVNAGVPGDTSEQGLARLPALLKEHQPELLMIELGGNDFLQKIAADKTKENLRAIIKAAKLKSIPSVLIAIPDYEPVKAAFGGLSDHPLYLALSNETQTPLIKETFTKVLSKSALKADYVHPNEEGYRQVEVQLRASLTELGLLNTN